VFETGYARRRCTDQDGAISLAPAAVLLSNAGMRSVVSQTVAPVRVRYRWRTGATLLFTAALAVLALRFLLSGVLPFIAHMPPEFVEFWPRRLAVLIHLTGGTIALLVGPFQLWSGLAAFRMDAHRWAGRVYVIAVLVGGCAAFYLSAYTQGLAKAMSLQALGVAWWTTTWMAYRAIRAGREIEHRNWAARSYAVTFSFVTFRLGLEAGVLTHLGSEPVPAWLWLSWTIPLFVTELVLRLQTRTGVELGGR
jgi:hypothetical protein